MNTTTLKKQSVTLLELGRTITPSERKIVDAEKKYYTLVIALKEKREKLGLTQQELAEISQLPRTTITKVESGSRNATLETLMKIAEALGSSVELSLS